MLQSITRSLKWAPFRDCLVAMPSTSFSLMWELNPSAHPQALDTHLLIATGCNPVVFIITLSLYWQMCITPDQGLESRDPRRPDLLIPDRDSHPILADARGCYAELTCKCGSLVLLIQPAILISLLPRITLWVNLLTNLWLQLLFIMSAPSIPKLSSRTYFRIYRFRHRSQSLTPKTEISLFLSRPPCICRCYSSCLEHALEA